MSPLLHELEAVVVDAWPAAESLHRDGWLLRASGGPTNRGNSVATLEATGVSSLGARIDHAEGWYRERGQAARFQIGPCARPFGLDAELAVRGYVKEGQSWFASAPAREVLALTARTGSTAAHSTSVDSSPAAAWLALSATASRFATHFQNFLDIIGRLGARCRFVTVRTDQGKPSAIGLGIASEHRLGVYAMLSAPSLRRSGAARAVLHALANSADEEGLRELYLLVDQGNTPARGLYAQSGFRDVYSYHYRVLARERDRGLTP